MNDDGFIPTLILSADTLSRLRLHADPMKAWRNTSMDLGNGFFRVLISDDTHEALEKIRFPGETDDDLISRVIEAHDGGGLN